jgi:hypothetical protein
MSPYSRHSNYDRPFAADLVLFGHTGQWKQVRLGNVDFLNVGALLGVNSMNMPCSNGKREPGGAARTIPEIILKLSLKR